MKISIFIFISYLIGSFTTADALTACFKLSNPRNHGSKSPGATNMMRLYGAKMGLLTMLGDGFKSFITLMIATSYLHLIPLWTSVAAFFCLLGHCYPIGRFTHGGKGIATGFGAVAALHGPIALTGLILFILVTAIWRYVSLASLCVALTCPFLALWLAPQLAIGFFLMSVVITWRHRGNIQRLIAGAEHRITLKASS